MLAPGQHPPLPRSSAPPGNAARRTARVAAKLRVLRQLHLNSTSACALDLNSTMPFCLAFTTLRVLPLSAQNSDASLTAALFTPKPFLSQQISDNEMRYVPRPDGATPEDVEHATQTAVARPRTSSCFTSSSSRALRPDYQVNGKNRPLVRRLVAPPRRIAVFFSDESLASRKVRSLGGRGCVKTRIREVAGGTPASATGIQDAQWRATRIIPTEAKPGGAISCLIVMCSVFTALRRLRPRRR